MSLPSWAILRSPIQIDPMRLDPCLGSTTRTAPVSIVTDLSSCEHAIAVAGATAAPTPSWSGPAMSGVATMDWPLHMTDPSGQYAIGQTWAGTTWPEAVLSTTESPFWTAPLGQGTPQLTLCGTAGGLPSSQLRVTDPAVWAWAGKASTASAMSAHARAAEGAGDMPAAMGLLFTFGFMVPFPPGFQAVCPEQ